MQFWICCSRKYELWHGAVCFYFIDPMCWCLHRHKPPNSLHTQVQPLLLESDTRSHRSSQLLAGAIPQHTWSQNYSQSTADAASTHDQLSLLSSDDSSHGRLLPIQVQSDPSLHLEMPSTPNSSQQPYPIPVSVESLAHEVCTVAHVCVHRIRAHMYLLWLKAIITVVCLRRDLLWMLVKVDCNKDSNFSEFHCQLTVHDCSNYVHLWSLYCLSIIVICYYLYCRRSQKLVSACCFSVMSLGS